MGFKVSWLQSVLRQNLTTKGCFLKYMCTPWQHSASRYCLLLQRADHLPSPTVFFWEHHLRKEIVQLAEAFLASPYDRRLLAFSNSCQAPCAQWRQRQNLSASAGRKSNSLPTIFSTNICHCLQAEAYLGILWSFLRVLLICAHSAVSPMLLLTKELMKSTWRPRASCKT